MTEWILLATYVGGCFPAWCLVYSLRERVEWARQEDARTEAGMWSVMWPLVVAGIVLWLMWRAFRATIIGLANLMQGEE